LTLDDLAVALLRLADVSLACGVCSLIALRSSSARLALRRRGGHWALPAASVSRQLLQVGLRGGQALRRRCDERWPRASAPVAQRVGDLAGDLSCAPADVATAAQEVIGL
jgi:hypothetical protein